MTDEQINALAFEYARVATPFDKDEFYYELNFHRYEKQFCECVKWLSARYAIVEKSKVLEEYAATYPDDPDRGIESIRCAYLLKDLFPELFKDEEK